MDGNTLGVVGAGPMGAGIAQIGLTAGMDVILYDVSAEAGHRAAAAIGSRIARLAEKGRITREAAEAATARLTIAEALDALAPCDVVVEAIVERLDVKQALFGQLEALLAPDAVLATNTSSLSVAAIAAHCHRKERVCGLHFFNPVPVMQLVEIVVAPGTAPATATRMEDLARRLGKTPVTVQDAPGFLVNLQGRAFVLEALAIVQEQVADPATVDRILRDAAGFRMGPFELMDLTGIDVNYPASTYIYEGYLHDPRLKTTTRHQAMFAAGLFGRKTGQGFFEYGPDVQPLSHPAAPRVGVTIRPRIVEGEGWEPITAHPGFEGGNDVSLIAPIGEDAATACARLGLDPRTTVAIDLTAADGRHLTVMHAVGGGDAAAGVAHWLRGMGFTVEEIGDSPGFVLQRILAMVANLGCELAQIGIATPQDIDLAMRLAQNYPRGPIEWAEWLGLPKTLAIMEQLQRITGSDRYRPSLWLRRRAQLGLSAYTPA